MKNTTSNYYCVTGMKKNIWKFKTRLYVPEHFRIRTWWRVTHNSKRGLAKTLIWNRWYRCGRLRTYAVACGPLPIDVRRPPLPSACIPHARASIRINPHMHIYICGLMRNDAGRCGLRADGRGGLRTWFGPGLHATACARSRPHRHQRFHISVLARPMMYTLLRFCVR